MNRAKMPLCSPLALLALLMAFPLARAEVSGLGSGGFTTSHSLEVAASPADSWQALVDVAGWWNGDHSWSGQAENLYLDARAGGCFCERLPNGGWVEHLRIVYLAPGRELRLQGALGPLMQLGVQGTMTWSVEATEEGGSRLSFTYVVHGHLTEGFDGIAPAVDGVIGEQLGRLGARLESG